VGSKTYGDVHAPIPSLVGLAEVAELLEVTKRTASAYTVRDDFPPPVQRLAATPVWRRDEVEAWAARTLPLRTGRPAKMN
jgi:predicted DNA-binding transcriptional regulator AlpA